MQYEYIKFPLSQTGGIDVLQLNHYGRQGFQLRMVIPGNFVMERSAPDGHIADWKPVKSFDPEA